MSKKETNITELRRDIVSGEWVLVATGRGKRPTQFVEQREKSKTKKAACPFDDPQKSGNGAPLLWFVDPKKRDTGKDIDLSDWFLQVIPNKYPALNHDHRTCPAEVTNELETSMEGVGFHEVIITRPHSRSIADMKTDEAELVIRAYQERIHDISAEGCVKYILIFHNHGNAAGASIAHPHSQLVALPIVPRDVHISLRNSKWYFKRHGKCVHCEMLKWEKKQKDRIIFENRKFVVFAPYAPSASFEVRIFPKKHEQRFESIATKDRKYFAEALQQTLHALKKALKDPAYNFYIHTAPLGKDQFDHYHWHLEILPKTNTPAGMELGTGMEVVMVTPEDAAELMRKHIS